MNKKRKYYKAKKIADYYYYKKGNYEKAIKMYKRFIKINYLLYKNIVHDDIIYEKIADSYLFLGENNLALKYCDLGLYCSPSSYKLLELKTEALKYLGRIEEVEGYDNKIQKVDDFCKNSELDLEQFYGTKKY